MAGRARLKTLTKRDRTLWWLTVMGSNVLATGTEALATAPAVDAVDLAVLSRIPDTGRLGVVAHGRWTRHALAAATLRTPEDALRFLDLGEDVTCTARTTTTRITAIDTATNRACRHWSTPRSTTASTTTSPSPHPSRPAPTPSSRSPTGPLDPRHHRPRYRRSPSPPARTSCSPTTPRPT